MMEDNMSKNVCVCVCVCVYTYTYIYMAVSPCYTAEINTTL